MKQKIFSVVEWRVTTDYQCLENLAADCTFNIAFCQAGRILNYAKD
jgi:hypothetical protein